ncbi:MAG: amidohydrolase family protein, partial [Lysobacterales bacterium]
MRDQHYLDQAKALTHEIAGAFCISNVAVLDVDAGVLNPDQNVRVEDGLITSISSDKNLTCQDAVAIDGSGRTLMPGLIDMHTHLSAGDGILNIANGVTGARDLGNNDEQLEPLMAQFANGEVIGPQVWAAGFIDAKSPFTAPIQAPAENLDDALAAIERFAAMGRRQVKIYSSIPPAWVLPMAEAIHSHGMRLSGHIPSGMSAEEAVLAGFDEIQHVNMLFLNFLAGPEDDTRTPLRFTLVGEKGGTLDLDSDKVTGFIELLRSRGIEIDSTVMVFRNMFLQRAGEVPEGFVPVASHLPPTVQRDLESGGMNITDENAAAYVASADALLQ